MKRGTVLITGATQGIGRALAIKFAREGHYLILTARGEDSLKDLSHLLHAKFQVKTSWMVVDFSDEACIRRIGGNVGRVDILVNNVGIGHFGRFKDVEPMYLTDILKVNLTAPLALARLLLPGMLLRKSGMILNVSSLAAFVPCQNHAVYCASKAALLSWSCALHNELKDIGISVTCLCPGSTDTNFFERARMKKDFNLMDPSEVAEIGYRGLMAGKPVVIAGRMNWLKSMLFRVLPMTGSAEIVSRIFKPFRV